MIDTAAFQGKKAAYYTLGCKLNFSETSTFARMLQEMGVATAEKGEQADICLVNTCSVTDVADHKCRQAICRGDRMLCPAAATTRERHRGRRPSVG